MSYTHLRLSERYKIEQLRLHGLSYREIGRRLGRCHTTIQREVDRNGYAYPNIPYNHRVAERRAVERWCIARHERRWRHLRLRAYVFEKLEADWSPEQIAGRLRRDHRRSSAMRVSPETIYHWVYRDAREGGTLWHHLRRARKNRRRHWRFGLGRQRFAGRVSISERPKVVDRRTRFGDWEGDSMLGKKGTGALATHVERKSRYLMAAWLSDGKSKTMMEASIDLFQAVPEVLQRTLTLDNGSEFASFKRLESATALKVYFADPYAPWQRGSNENTNGLLRQYFPKGSSFQNISPHQLEKATKALNHRPRKCLAYRTPHEVLEKAINGALTI